MIGIYKVTNLINNKVYIGQSVHIETRWKSHQNDYNNINYSGYNTMFYNAIRKYGINNFKFEIIEECNLNELNEKETYWIKYYNSYIGFQNCNGYNMTLGGDNFAFGNGTLAKEQVEEIKQLLLTTDISQVELGKRYGVSAMTISDINRGITWTDESLNYPLRVTNIRKNRFDKLTLSKEELYNLLLKNNGNFTLTAKQLNVTTTTLYKWCRRFGLPASSQNYKSSKKEKSNNIIEENNNNYTNTKKSVYMIDKQNDIILKQFDSLTEAANFLNKPNGGSHIGAVCENKRKSAYGYKWKWKK